MAITTFAELKTAILDWSDVNDAITTTAAGDFVTLSTHLFNHGAEDIAPLRMREMQAVELLTPDSGACALPDDYLQYRRVVEVSGTRRELAYIAPSTTDELYPSRQSGLANHFTIIGSSLYMFPVSTNDIELTYYQAIPDLSDDSPSNWLLEKHPSLYLQGGLYHLGLYRRDDDMASRSAAILKSLMAGVSRSGFTAEFARASTRLKLAP
jgi:hypothetical protein